MKNQKRAQGAPMALVSMLATVFLLFFAVFGVIFPMMDDFSAKMDFSIDKLEYDVHSSEIIYSSSCLAYKDDLGRVHPGLIDMNKISGSTIVNCYHGDSYVALYEISEQKIAASPLKEAEVTGGSGTGIPRRFLVRYLDSQQEEPEIKTGVLEVAL